MSSLQFGSASAKWKVALETMESTGVAVLQSNFIYRVVYGASLDHRLTEEMSWELVRREDSVGDCVVFTQALVLP